MTESLTSAHPAADPVTVDPVTGDPVTGDPVSRDVSFDPEPTYAHALHRPGLARWRGIVAIVVLLVGYLGINLALSFGSIMGDIALGNTSMEALRNQASRVTPLMLLAVNLSAAALIPLSMLLQRWLFGVRGGSLSSIRGMFRWRLLAKVALIVVPLWLIYVGISMIAGMPGMPTSYALNVSVPLLLVVLATTWVQAAGEEYGFRGLITRSTGSWFANPRTALVVSTLVANLLFMVAHFALDPWLIAYYFLFGVSCSVVTWRTGGLEASIALHVTNNVVLLLTAALFMGGEVDMDRSLGTGGPFMLAPIGMMVLVAILVSWWAGRRQLTRTASSL